MKRFLLLVALFIAPMVISDAADPVPVAAPVPRAVFTAKHPSDSQVLVRRIEPDGTGFGTATAVAFENGKTLLLTCAHVTHNGEFKYEARFNKKDYEAKFAGGMKYKRTVLILPNGVQLRSEEVEEDTDLALLTVEVEIPIVPIAKANAREGDKMRQWGFSTLAISEDVPGHRKGVVSERNNAQWIAGNLPSDFGDSGSGLFNDKDELFGVTAAGSFDIEAIRTIGPSAEIAREFLLKKAGKDFPRLRARLSEFKQMP